LKNRTFLPASFEIPRLFRLSYYKAPPVVQVAPYVLRKNIEVVELVTEGVVRFEVNGQETRLGCGALFWHSAGDETIHLTDPKSPYECLAVAFTVGPRMKSPVPRLSVITDHQRTRDLCRELLGAYQEQAVDQEILKRYTYTRLLWETQLARAWKFSPHRPSAVEAAVAFAETAFREPATGVREMAFAAGISEPHLHALFRKHTGETPHQFLHARRIREAKERLAGTRESIKSIAAECGFQNIETFYRAFKRTVGDTPHQFRQKRNLPILARR